MGTDRTVIRIQEQSEQDDGFRTAVSFDYGPPYPITVRNPFTEEQEKELEWYFEKHLRFPYTKKVRAKEAATSIIAYGETLFQQVFQENHQVIFPYKTAVQAGLQRMQIEIAGSPKFHALHWEALKDPDLPKPLALQAVMVRQNSVPQVVQVTTLPSPMIKLLIVTARPLGKKDIGYRTISRPLVETLRQAQVPVHIDILRPGTYKALENHLRAMTSKHGVGYYHVIHFDMHGSLLTYEQFQQLNKQFQQGDGQALSRHVYHEHYALEDIQPYDGAKAFLLFEGEQDNPPTPVEAASLANMLLEHQVPIVILNACQSGKQVGDSETSLGSRLMQAGVQLVLAMGYSVTVSAAELLMKTLYKQLFDKNTLSLAICNARRELYNDKRRRAYFGQIIDLEDWLLPVVYQNAVPTLPIREFTAEENKAHFEGEAERARRVPPEPTYGFVGRDLDILQIEKRLLTKRNLLRGMGGAGKTTLLRHLESWWYTTGLVNQVFYFGYDEHAWTRQQIMVEIAQRLFDPVTYVRDLQPLSLDAQQALLAKRLRAENHLLILDNLESITGANMAILHTLPQDEQRDVRRLLADLANGRTLVLLGSRGSEEWLANGSFEDNVFDLSGLDPEAASLLADRILEKHRVTKYRLNNDFQHLLKLLDGFPLALEVVLSNLARQSPTEVLSALQAGDVVLDKGDPEEKTKSILRCIDYSHSNLSPEAQQLLLCLAPFTGVCDRELLENYVNHLKQQAILATLPFERWPQVLQEAINWGLLSPEPEIPRFLRVQPILPYFLRNRLSAPDQASVRVAIETAFREHYAQVGKSLSILLSSKDPQDGQIGQFIARGEYENLVTALNLALVAQESINGHYDALLYYLNSTQDQRRSLELFQTIEKGFAAYPAEKLDGPLGVEFAQVIGTIANAQLDLKQYDLAIVSYQKVLKLVDRLNRIDEVEKKRLKAYAHHNLGRVAQEQRQWAQAEQYYQQALQIKGEYNDRYAQARTYHQLGMVAQEQRQWAQAEQYYQQALQIKGEYNDRYEQASTYHQLGRVAQEQGQWAQARDCLLLALDIFVTFEDTDAIGVTLRNLATLWQASSDASLPNIVAEKLGMTGSEVEKLWNEILGDGNDTERE